MGNIPITDLLEVNDTTRLRINRFIEPYERQVRTCCDYCELGGLEKELLDELKYRTANLLTVMSLASRYEIKRIEQIEKGIIPPIPVREDIDWSEILAESETSDSYKEKDTDFPEILTCSNAEIGDILTSGKIRTILLTYVALHNAKYDQSIAVNTNWRRSRLWGYQYTAVLDGNTRINHKSQHGVTAPKDSVFWKRWYPPNGYCCRCRCYPLYRRPKNIIDPKPIEPDAGFDFNPGNVTIIEGRTKIEDMIQK